MLLFELTVLAVLAVSIAIAYVFIKRGKALLGVALGILPLAIMELAFNWQLNTRIQNCLESACVSSGLPLGCTVGDFGCNEWSGLAQFMFLAAGIISLVLYAIGVMILAFFHSRKSLYPAVETGRTETDKSLSQ